MGIKPIVVSLPRFVRICGIVWGAARDRPYAYSYARLVPLLTYGLHRINVARRVYRASNFSGYGIASEGFLEGIIEMIIGEMLWLFS